MTRARRAALDAATRSSAAAGTDRQPPRLEPSRSPSDGPCRGEAQPVGTGGLDDRLQALMDQATEAERRLLAGVTLSDLAGRKDGRPRKGG